MIHPGLVWQDVLSSETNTRRLGGDVPGGSYVGGRRYEVASAGGKEKIDYADGLTLLMEQLFASGEFSMRCVFQVSGGSADDNNKIVHLGLTNGNAVGCAVNGQNYGVGIYNSYFEIDGTHYTATEIDNEGTGWVDLVITYKFDAVTYGVHYVNGVEVSTGETVTYTTAETILSNGKLDAKFEVLQLFDRQLTAEEIANLYAGVSLTNPGADLAELYLLNGTANDLQRNVWDLDEAPAYHKIGCNHAGYFDGSNELLTTDLNGDTAKTFSFIFKHTGADQPTIFCLDNANDVTVTSDTIVAAWADNCFVNGVDTHTVTNGWNFVTLIDTGGIIASDLNIGYDEDSVYFTGLFDSLLVDSTEWDLAKHTQFYTASWGLY